MREVTIEVAELRKILIGNRSTHRQIFEEAVEGYKKEAVKQLEDYIRRIKSGSLKKVYVSLPEPADHTRDYDRALHMLELHQGDTIGMNEHKFAELVEDDWAWKRQFLTTNSAYSGTAARMLSDEDDD